jgi:hypothetical protein
VAEIHPSCFGSLVRHGSSISLEERLFYHKLKINKMNIGSCIPMAMIVPYSRTSNSYATDIKAGRAIRRDILKLHHLYIDYAPEIDLG